MNSFCFDVTAITNSYHTDFLRPWCLLLFSADSLFSYLMGVCRVLPPLSVLSLDLFVGVTSLSFVQPGGSQSINNNNHALK